MKISKKIFRKKLKRVEFYFMDSIGYLKDNLNYVFFAAAVFLFGGIVGFAFSENFTFIDDIMKDLMMRIEGMGAFDLIVFIFQNNVKSAFFGLVLGLIFGIVPLFNALGNGVVLGYVLKSVWKITGLSEFWRLLPHGVFELPAVFIALGLGIKLGFSIFLKKERGKIRKNLKKSLIAFVLIVVPLLVVAAIIEGLLVAFIK